MAYVMLAAAASVPMITLIIYSLFHYLFRSSYIAIFITPVYIGLRYALIRFTPRRHYAFIDAVYFDAPPCRR